MADQPTTQDFTNGIDYTAQNLTGSLLNNGFAFLAGNVTDDSQSGISPMVWTLDQALNTPLVPNPGSSGPAIKWKNYLWVRFPYSTDGTDPAIIYTWNDNMAEADPTFLKWVSTAFNPATINAQLATLTTNVAAAVAQSNTANTNSTNALNQANAAVTVANNSASQINSLSAQVVSASNAASQANSLAQQASATASTANTNANAAITAATTNRNLNQINQGAAGQRIRTNASGSSLEYYNASDTVLIIQQSSNNQNFVSGINTVVTFDTKLRDTLGLITSLNAGAFVLAKGVYKLTAQIKLFGSINGTNFQGTLVNSGGVTLFTGLQDISAVIIADGNLSFSIKAYNTSGGALAGGLSLLTLELIG